MKNDINACMKNDVITTTIKLKIYMIDKIIV